MRSSSVRGAAKAVDHRKEQKGRHRKAKFGSEEFFAPGRKTEPMRESRYLTVDPQDNSARFHVEEYEKLSAPMALLVDLYYAAGRNEEQLEDVLERIGSPKRGVALDLRERILEDLAHIRGTPWLPDPRVRAHGSAYSNTR